ncbi:hypothetical protein SALBM311S_05084 [Streptomyces alboniger]
MGAVQGQRQQAVSDGRGRRGRVRTGVQVQLPEPQVPVQARWGCCCSGRARTARCRRDSRRGGPGSGWRERKRTAEKPAATAGSASGSVIRTRHAAGRSAGPSGSPRARRSWSNGSWTCCAAAWRARTGGVRAVGGDGGRDGRRPGLRSRGAGAGVGGDSVVRPGWPVRLLESLPSSISSTQGWLRRERLPDGLAATVRSRVGLPASAGGPPLRDSWLVLAQHDLADARLVVDRAARPGGGRRTQHRTGSGSYPWSFSGVMGMAERCLDPSEEVSRLDGLLAVPDETEDASPGRRVLGGGVPAPGHDVGLGRRCRRNWGWYGPSRRPAIDSRAGRSGRATWGQAPCEPLSPPIRADRRPPRPARTPARSRAPSARSTPSSRPG